MAGDNFRDRPVEPTLQPISPAGREHSEMTRTVTQKPENALGRLLPLKERRIDLNSESAGNHPGRFVLFCKSPLHEQLADLRECLCAAGVVWLDVEEVQLTPCGQGNTQGMRKGRPAEVRKISRMQDRINGHSAVVMPDFVPSVSFGSRPAIARAFAERSTRSSCDPDQRG